MEYFGHGDAGIDNELRPPQDGASLTIPSTSQSKDSPSDSPGRTRSRSRTLSQVPFPFRSSAVEGVSQDISRIASVSDNPAKSDKARQETRKLLSHILNELRNRPRPPPAWATLSYATGTEAPQSSGGRRQVYGPTSFGGPGTRTRLTASSDSDSDGESSMTFSPGITFDFLNKLRDVLILAKLKDWRIFDDGADPSDPLLDSTTKQSSFRFRRSSFTPNGRRSRSISPTRSKKNHSGLLSLCLSLLHSIVMEDCRYQFHSLKLDRPPNALQALTLNVAQIIAFMYKEDARILYELSLAMIPSFTSFPKSMHGLLISFFDGSILRSMLLTHGSSLKASVTFPNTKTAPDDSGQGSEDVPIVAIQVDEANDDSPFSPPASDWQHWIPLGQSSQFFPSSYAPCRTPECYYACSAISPLLAALLDTIELSSGDPVLSHRLYTFLALLADSKIDLPLNLLEVISHYSRGARMGAITILSMFWPRACGHLCIGKPYPRIQYGEDLRTYGQGKMAVVIHHQHSHQFMPWLFKSRPDYSEGPTPNDCHSCSKQVDDFGLVCPLCLCIIHMNCYDSPDGTFLSHYPVSNGNHTRRVAVHRFSHLKPLPNEPRFVRRGQHSFGQVTIFTLSLCSICHLPLWGYVAQGYRCGRCNQYAHSRCLDCDPTLLSRCHPETDVECISIIWEKFLDSFTMAYKDIILAGEDLHRCTYEEVSTYWSVLLLQLHLLKSGLASGSIEITRDQSPGNIDRFELHRTLDLYHVYLDNNTSVFRKSTPGPQENVQMVHSKEFMFDWSMLSYVTSCLRSPYIQDDAGQDLLNVLPSGDDAPEGTAHVSEVTSLAQLRDSLGSQFGLKLQESACIVIRHLHHIGFILCDDLPDSNIDLRSRSSEIQSKFVLPLGLDLSSDVELLISAVEACLDDMNIAVNETGFLLLTRRFPPSEMMSDYAFSRLVMSVIKWVLAEDDNLVIILRQYIGKQQDPPGVPSVNESRIWPSYLPSRSSSTGSFASGSDYLTCRKTLLHKYASRWLAAFHQCNPQLYSSLLFTTVDELARDVADRFDSFDVLDTEVDKSEITSKENLLRYILKLCQASIAFSAADELLRTWLDVMTDGTGIQTALSGLPRLFNREADGSARWTIAPDATITSFEMSESSLKDPWRIVASIASSSNANLRKALGWLCTFASSGVDIPVYIFRQFSDLTHNFHCPFADLIALAESIFKATWMKSVRRQELHALISDLHIRCAGHVIAAGQESTGGDDASRFLRLTLSSLLLLHGCDRTRLQDLELVSAKDVEGLMSRRKVTRTVTASDSPILDESSLIMTLTRYTEARNERLRLLVVKYFAIFVTETSYLSSEEIDDFIQKNGSHLIRIAWKLYDMHSADISNLRAMFLLRLLSVNVEFLTELLHNEDRDSTIFMTQFDSVSRLFQVILDVNRPAFRTIDKQKLRTSVIQLFYRFFERIWTDKEEEVRMAAQSWSRTLQLAHYKSITSFFSDALLQLSLPEKLELVSFLLQLRPHFPPWKVLSWEAIVETLMEDDFMQKNDTEDGAISAHLSMYGIASARLLDATESKSVEAGALQSSLLLLSLEMIADGIPVDLFSLLKIKLQLAVLLGFSSANLVPAANGQSFYVNYGEMTRLRSSALPCLSGLMMLLDSRKPFQLPTSAMTVTNPEDDITTSALVGSAFLDIFLHTIIYAGESPTEFPNSQLKILLQSAVIVIYKHDLESPPLRHLRDLLRRVIRVLSAILPENVGHEIKQLALTGILAFRNRWPLSSNRDMLSQIVTNVIRFLSAHGSPSDDATHGQGTSLLQDIFSRHHAIFFNLSKRHLDKGTFSVLKIALAKNARNVEFPMPLGEVVFKDTLQALANINVCSTIEQKMIFENIQQYVEVVHKQGYSGETLTLTGECFVAVLRYASEWSTTGFDASPLFLTAATLIQYNKANVRGLLQHLESALRIALLRCDISRDALQRVLQTTSALYRRLASDPAAQGIERNVLLTATIEVLSDCLRGKCRMTSVTIDAGIASVCSDSPTFFSSEVVSRLASDAFHFIQNWATTSDHHQQYNMQASKAACSLVLHVTHNDIGFLSRQMNEYEKNGKHALAVRMWNILVLEALQKPSLKGVTSQVFAHLPAFSAAYHSSLRSHIQTFGVSQDVFSFDINQAYIAIKLWLLLSSHSSEVKPSDERTDVSPDDQITEDRNASLVWNELWPAFENLVSLSDPDAEMVDVTPISSLVWSSIADIFLFLRVSRNSVSLESSAHMGVLNRMREVGRGDSHARKLMRTANSITEIPPRIPMEVLIAQIEQELKAAEKLLQALALGIGKSLPERSRRDLRMPTG